MKTASDHKVPAAGPRDPVVWLTLLALHDSDRGAIDPETGDVYVGNTLLKVRYKVKPAHLDELIACGWVDDTRGHDELCVTDKGRYWLARFVRLNGGELS